jgi:ABC-type transporter Mla subunit MlaD
MNITINLVDLAYGILFLLVLGIGGYLFVTLKNLNGLLAEVRELLEINRQNIDQSLTNLPVITENLSEASFGIKRGVGQAEEIIDQVSDNVGDALVTVNKTADTLSTYSVIVTEIVKSLAKVIWKVK